MWLRWTMLDDLDLNVPTTVRARSRAATGPHIAGIEAEPAVLATATRHERPIGIALDEVLDRVAANHAGG